jgi:hypothetical protein
VHDEGVSGHGGLDVEGAGLGVASGDALDVALVVAAGVDGGGVDGIAGVDGEDGFIQRGELPVEDGGSKLVALGRRGGAGWGEGGGEGVGERIRLLVDVDRDEGSGEGAVFERRGGFGGVALLVLGQEMDGAGR